MAANVLGEYSAKRRFTATPEPPAKRHEGQGPLLFVVQQHAASHLHFDLRLECDGVLLSWAVPRGAPLAPGDKRLAMRTEDHPYDYAAFEGVIPKGEYGAGRMIVWDAGVYSPDESARGTRDETFFHDRDEAQRRVREGLARGKLSILLRGEKLKGSYALVRTAKEPKSWLLLRHKDAFAGGPSPGDASVLSGATLGEVARRPATDIPAARLVPAGKPGALPKSLEPMQAQIADAPFRDEAWSWEPKLDGYRVLAFVDGSRVALRSRRGLDLTSAFPRIVAELRGQLAHGMVLDGEIVAFEDARPSFHALQGRVQLKTAAALADADRRTPAVFYAFDLPYFGGVDLRGAPYRDRRRWLSQCLLPSAHVQRMHADDDGVALHEAAAAAGFEGVIGKRKDSGYESGKRPGSWIKVKPTQTADFVIGGFTRGKGGREALGAVLVGLREGRKLRYVSHVGSGFDGRALAALLKRLKPLVRKTPPFSNKPPTPSPTTWVEPQLVAELEFHSWTPDGHLRAPVFRRLRDAFDVAQVRAMPSSPRMAGSPSAAGGEKDKLNSRIPRNDDHVAEVLAQLDQKEKDFLLHVGEHRLKVTHLDRVYWPADATLDQPAVTKRDLLRYFTQVSPHILTHLCDRPLTMIRFPEGIRGQRFFQKHWEQDKPAFARTITVFSESHDESSEYLLCNDLPTLLWLAQSGTLEFHVWHSRAAPGEDAAGLGTDYGSSLAALEASLLNHPDYVVFDIDPYIYSGLEAKGGEPELNTVAFEKGKEVAFRLRELLRTMQLDPIVKTSGKTGLHVFVPIRRTIDFDAARHVSELVGRHLMRLHPDDITMEWSIPKRTGKIFMDYNMNVRAKTLNVAYSPRGVAGAPVSMPLTWEELAKAHPLDFRIGNAAARLARTGDRWREALTAKQSLERALETPAAAPPKKKRRHER
ncbi:MAG TPA: non-homologous end-joining DNA ligase [Candidatus Binatia bacterium]|nr:non-homologous end-joining DNA ligase [Candidatus Binatia bacterium]